MMLRRASLLFLGIMLYQNASAQGWGSLWDAHMQAMIDDARIIALNAAIKKQARERGANAIVGIDIDYETVGEGGSMLMVSVSGTAVTVR